MAYDFYLQSLDPWIRNNPELLALWIEGAELYGGDNALEYVQDSPVYDIVFPGNKRPDGSLRHSEDQYLSITDQYTQSLIDVGLNPANFEHRYADLIEGEVSPREFFVERLEPMYDRILERSDELIARYAQDYGIDLTPEALLASALDPELQTKVLNRQIALSELKAESDMTLGTEVTDRYAPLIEDLLDTEQMTQPEAQAYFRNAQTMMPVLSTLAARHADPDDDFDLAEFTAASIYNDPAQRRRMRRLTAQEDASFSGGSGIDFTQTRTGGVAGLQQR